MVKFPWENEFLFLLTTEMMMSPPQRLRGTVISYVRIMLDWDVPYRYPGSVQNYKVYYRAHGWSNYMNVSILICLLSWYFLFLHYWLFFIWDRLELNRYILCLFYVILITFSTLLLALLLSLMNRIVCVGFKPNHNIWKLIHVSRSL